MHKFAYVEQSENVIQRGKESFTTVKGNWNSNFFKNDHEIILELGCGKGEYTIGLSQQIPDNNFIGVDIKGNRLSVGAKMANDNDIKNVSFLRTPILDIEDFFNKGEVSEIWVTFPDPRMKDSDEKRRLVSPRFLDLYKKVLKSNGIINLKTDNFPLYEYSLELVKSMGFEILASTDDLYQSEYLDLCYGLQTTYEKKYLEKGIKINYLRFVLP